jgi:predicted nucleic acid-binding protein
LTCVIDVSVALKWFLPEADSPSADNLLAAFLNDEVQLHAPDLLLLEAASALWRRTVLLKQLTSGEAASIYQDLLTIPLNFHPTERLTGAAFRLAMKYSHPVYDAVYCALAADLDCEFVTADQILVTKLRDVLPFVRHLSTVKR